METKLIFKKIPIIMSKISFIGKNHRNEKQGYKFRSIDDIMSNIKEILSSEGVFIIPKVVNSFQEIRESKSGGTNKFVTLDIDYYFYADDGSYIVATVRGEGMDSGDKANYKAMSGAFKYALTQVFCIPTEEKKDPEFEEEEEKKLNGVSRQEYDDLLLLYSYCEKFTPPTIKKYFNAIKYENYNRIQYDKDLLNLTALKNKIDEEKNNLGEIK